MPTEDQSQPNTDAVGVLDQDVGCPACGYNLRGLGSDIVDCPECGLRSDVAKLLVRRWDKPWYKAPKFNMICIPAAIVLLGLFCWFVTLGVLAYGGTSGRMIGLMWMVGSSLCWIAAMSVIWSRLDGWISVGFAALAHVPVLGYLAGIIMLLYGVILTYVAIDDRKSDTTELVIGILLLIGGSALFFLARWVERLVAGHCIRLYLRMPTTSG